MSIHFLAFANQNLLKAMKSFQGHYLCSEFFQILFNLVKTPNGLALISGDVIVFLFSHCYLSFLSANTRMPLGTFLSCAVWELGNHETAYRMSGNGRQALKKALSGISGIT